MLPFNKRLIIKSILIIISLLYNASRNTGVYFIHRVNYNYNTNIKLSMIVPLLWKIAEVGLEPTTFGI